MCIHEAIINNIPGYILPTKKIDEQPAHVICKKKYKTGHKDWQAHIIFIKVIQHTHPVIDISNMQY